MAVSNAVHVLKCKRKTQTGRVVKPLSKVSHEHIEKNTLTGQELRQERMAGRPILFFTVQDRIHQGTLVWKNRFVVVVPVHFISAVPVFG